MVIFVCIFDQISSLRYFKLVINAENPHTNVGVLNWWSVEDKPHLLLPKEYCEQQKKVVQKNLLEDHSNYSDEHKSPIRY